MRPTTTAKRRRDERNGRGAGEEEEQEKAKRKTKKQRAKRGDRTVLSAFIRHEDSLLSEVPVRVTPSAIDDPSLSKSVFSCWRREHCCHKLSLSSNFFHSLPSKISLLRGRARPLSFSVDGSSRRNEFRSSDFLLDSWFKFLPGWGGDPSTTCYRGVVERTKRDDAKRVGHQFVVVDNTAIAVFVT